MGQRISTRYTKAIGSHDLRAAPTGLADVDYLGAAGLAAKSNELAMLLARARAGDNHASQHLVPVLAGLLWGKAQALRVKLKRPEADELARAVLAWHRDPGCKTCSSLGFRKMVGAPALSGDPCPTCRGTGRMPFDSLVAKPHLEVARWLQAKVERDEGRAGALMVRALGS
ncbi:hypothetical protein BurJ1DRAFT_2546 [Burkholderiales bacterium JOSHI_001]|nr:hypothetical protein BurJ1DRAFT_2546 [Burkholderiales bacterium JOSHI_001]